MTPRRWRVVGVGGLLLAAIAGLVVAGRPWWTVETGEASFGMSGTTSSGGLATGLSLLVGAGVPLVLVLRPVGRRIVAVIVMLGAAGMILAGAAPTSPGDEVIRAELRQQTLAEATGLSATAWPTAYLILGVVALLAGLSVLITAGRWPTRGDRFDRRNVDVTRDDPHEVWKALDAGLDPTVDETDRPDSR